MQFLFPGSPASPLQVQVNFCEVSNHPLYGLITTLTVKAVGVFPELHFKAWSSYMVKKIGPLLSDVCFRSACKRNCMAIQRFAFLIISDFAICNDSIISSSLAKNPTNQPNTPPKQWNNPPKQQMILLFSHCSFSLKSSGRVLGDHGRVLAAGPQQWPLGEEAGAAALAPQWDTVNPKVRDGRGEDVLQVGEQRVPCSPWRTHTRTGGCFWKELWAV